MFKPTYLKQAGELLHGARKLVRYRRDILPADQLCGIESRIATLEAAAKSKDREPTVRAMEDLDSYCAEVAPQPRDAGWRENCEVLLVAVVIAAGIKAYFLQPFKIPTGSMQPTLNGIVGTPMDGPGPNIVRHALEYVFLGRNYIDVVSKSDGNRVLDLQEFRRLHFFTFTRMVCTDGARTVYAPRATLVQHFKVNGQRTYNRGDVIARGRVDTGDQVFVDKVTYHFRFPRRGEVFVFRTTGIRKIEDGLDPRLGSQFYIKRLVGLPGDTLRIDPPVLFVNGGVATEPAIERVIRGESGYRGYSNTSEDGREFAFLGTPDATITVPPRCYWAQGDNSFNSSDSRHWGTVPERNVVGRGMLVYWPFTHRWGAIN